MKTAELHYTQRTGWLRAAVLGANDGILSTASLILGVAAADASPHGILADQFAGAWSPTVSVRVG